MREGRLEITGGHEIYYQIHGHAPNSLVGLHGGPGGDLTSLRRFAELSDDSLQVVLYDQLGGGRSERPDDPSLWTMARFVSELEELRAQLDLGQMHLVGRSWGGFLGLQYTLDYPDAVRTLCVSNAGASVFDELRGMTRLRSELDSDTLAPLLLHESASEFEHPDYLAAVERVYAAHFRRSSPFDPARSLEELRRDVLPHMSDLGPAYQVMWGPNEFMCTGNLRDWDVTERLAEIVAPTLIVAGWHDMVSVESHRVMAELIPDNEFVIFGNASHALLEEKDADAYLGVVKHFVTRHLA